MKLEKEISFRDAKDRLIIALDVRSIAEVKELVRKLGDNARTYKVGLELYLNCGEQVIEYLHGMHKRVFLDLKFYDIPNTTQMAVLYTAINDVFMSSLHATGGESMMKAVAGTLDTNDSDSKVIGVTVLTSFSEDEFETTFKSKLKIKDMVIHLAKSVQKSGLHGVVCSALEAKSIKEATSKDFLAVCPGIRPKWSVKNDQERIMTPKDAIENGADFLVVGRPITSNEKPKEALKLILAEMQEGIEMSSI